MKRLYIYLLLPVLLFATGTCLAQSAGYPAATASSKTHASQAIDAPAISDTTGSADATPTAIGFTAEPNPTKGMLNVKTECAGKLYFYSQKGKEKGACIVNQGDNPIFLQTVLNPGVYTCKFEGINGNTGTIKVIYKP